MEKSIRIARGFVQQYQKELFYLGLALVIFIAYRVVKTRSIRKLELDILPNAPAPRGGFNAEAEAKMLHDELSGWNIDLGRRAGVFQHFLDYMDNEVILVHNAYLKLYQNAKRKTLAELVRGEWVWTPGEYWGNAKKFRDEILLRLRTLGAA
ncbi:MAG: hypothetical protein AAF242_16240 [Bacteroidota bacterium]